MADTKVRLVTALEPVTGDEAVLSSVGGRPHAAEWPKCRTHQVPMVLFFQIAAAEGGAPLRGSEHLLVFQCPQWNDTPEFASEAPPGGQLPARFWEAGEGHYAFFLNPSAAAPLELEPHLVHSRMVFADAVEQPKEFKDQAGKPFNVGIRGFKLGGVPSWAQDPQIYRCQCGADMEPLVQVPVSYAFPKTPEAPEQPGSYSKRKYMIFLGNETYLFACTKRCDPQALYAAVQN